MRTRGDSIESAGVSDVGIRRRGRVNEDAFICIEAAGMEDGVLLAVADGMGGAAAGDLASATAIAVVAQEASQSASIEGLGRAFFAANSAVHELSAGDPSKTGAGTTLVGAIISGKRLWVANVGDSRAYRYRDGKLHQLTVDHSYVQEEITAGRLARDEAHEHPGRSLITRSIGVEPTVDVDLSEWDLREQDVVLLCSDGLSSTISDSQIGQIIAAKRGRPGETGEALVNAANAAGGPDNVTAVIARIGARDLPKRGFWRRVLGSAARPRTSSGGGIETGGRSCADEVNSRYRPPALLPSTRALAISVSSISLEYSRE